MPFTVIASDENYLRSAANVTHFTIAPGERYDILVDFSGLAAGTKVQMLNTANAPFPDGDAANQSTNGQVMQFTVQGNAGFPAQVLPAILNPTLASGFPSLSMASVTKERNLTMVEWQGPNGPQMVILDGQQYSSPVSETPVLGTTEVWRMIDDTGDAHPLHIHLINFQVVSRQKFDQERYDADWLALNGPLPFNHTTINLDLNNYLTGSAEGPGPLEQGWKDTIQVFPGEVLTVIIRFAPVDGTPQYPFDATEGPDYIWHCHIVDHEDQDMIRPYRVLPAARTLI
jgi:FtsP/CotA-like multicopper oxidase with cupredoxin domain